MADKSDRMIACCGLVCTECPAYLATKENDEKKVAEIAQQWSKEYGADVQPESVWCDGCLVDGKKCAHCFECEIRACARERGHANCGLCGELDTCSKIQDFFKMAPPAKEMIDSIRNRNNN